MRDGHSEWTCSMDIWHGHVHMYVHVHVHTYILFSHIYGHICIYVYIYLYVVKISFNFVSPNFWQILSKQDETWPWQNEISAKFHEISFCDKTEKDYFREIIPSVQLVHCNRKCTVVHHTNSIGHKTCTSSIFYDGTLPIFRWRL
jgi:hypothetical protein